MKHSDYLQFNECIAKLLFFYRVAQSDHKVSFNMCRAVQFGLSGMTSELHKFLHELPIDILLSPRFKIALAIIEAVNTFNYTRLLNWLVDTSDLYMHYIVNLFAVRIRVWVLRIVADRLAKQPVSDHKDDGASAPA